MTVNFHSMPTSSKLLMEAGSHVVSGDSGGAIQS